MCVVRLLYSPGRCPGFGQAALSGGPGVGSPPPQA